jgi:uncharacterized membrane protein YhaH (DUF805 family)
MKKLWFKRKSYGWGWTPSSWEGWLSLFVWLLFFVYIVKEISPENIFVPMACIAILTSALITLCYAKGEKPKWQWGKNEK